MPAVPEKTEAEVRREQYFGPEIAADQAISWRTSNLGIKVLAPGTEDDPGRRARIEREAKEAATRKSLVGSGDRSDRIRTYNFPQGRLTDHRINLTLYKLGSIMDGDLDDVLAALRAAQAQAQLAALEGSAG